MSDDHTKKFEIICAIEDNDTSRLYQVGESAIRSYGLLFDRRTQTEVTPLHLAISLEHVETVEALLLLGSSTESVSSDGILPIEKLRFLSSDSERICHTLLCPTYNSGYDKKTLYTLLLRAIRKLKPQSVRELIANGAPAHESSRLIGHYRSKITTPLSLWAGMELEQTAEESVKKHHEIGATLLKANQPKSSCVQKALLRAIAVGNRPAAEAIIQHGVNLTVNADVSLFERDALVTAIEGHYSMERREEFILLVLNSGYRIVEELQDTWIRCILPVIVGSRGMTSRTVRLVFSLLGKVCRDPTLWQGAIHSIHLEMEECKVDPLILDGLTRLQQMDCLNLMNMTRDSIRRRCVVSSPETIYKATNGCPPSIQRFLLLEDVFPDK